MKTERNFGLVILAIWLILMGVEPFLKLSIPSRPYVMAVLALAAGVLLLLGK